MPGVSSTKTQVVAGTRTEQLVTRRIASSHLSSHSTCCRFLQNVRPPLKDVPQQFHKLIERCWDKDPDARPDFEEICTILEGMVTKNTKKG